MTPQELKNSILQLAIQGKLVEQRPEEGTAKELFVRIQEEKLRLIAEKKIKKEKPLPEITEDEKTFDIPESWMWVRWGDLSESIQYGYNAPAQSTGRIKMVRISDIQEGKVLWETVATVYKGNIIKNLIMDCQSYTKYRPNETTGGIFVSWRRKEELPTGA